MKNKHEKIAIKIILISILVMFVIIGIAFRNDDRSHEKFKFKVDKKISNGKSRMYKLKKK